MGIQVLASRGLDLSEASHSSVRQDHGPRQLGDEFLHGLSYPKRGIGPERCPKPWVVSLRRRQEAGDPLLHEFLSLDPRAGWELASETGDGRQEGVDQLSGCIRIPGLGGEHQTRLLLRREPFGAR
jgi:hypothetical protein